MGKLTKNQFMAVANEIEKQFDESKMTMLRKPKICFYTNGDVRADCYDTYRKFYPNFKGVTFRTPFMRVTKPIGCRHA